LMPRRCVLVGSFACPFFGGGRIVVGPRLRGTCAGGPHLHCAAASGPARAAPERRGATSAADCRTSLLSATNLLTSRLDSSNHYWTMICGLWKGRSLRWHTPAPGPSLFASSWRWRPSFSVTCLAAHAELEVPGILEPAPERDSAPGALETVAIDVPGCGLAPTEPEATASPPTAATNNNANATPSRIAPTEAASPSTPAPNNAADAGALFTNAVAPACQTPRRRKCDTSTQR
jgi:hypothetical protein